jgi:hypothetical protein
MDKRPDLLYGSQDTILAYLVAEVILTLRTVSRDTTASYYHRLREGVASGSWQARAVVHRLWPDDGHAGSIKLGYRRDGANGLQHGSERKMQSTTRPTKSQRKRGGPSEVQSNRNQRRTNPTTIKQGSEMPLINQ